MRNLIVLIATVFVAWGVIQATTKSASVSGDKETAYERVLRTGVLRCAYGLWEPAVMRDPNTGEFSGIVYDAMQAIGKSLNIKVEYTMEVSWDAISNALATGKADAHCAGIWATPARGRNMAFTHPLFFSPTVVFARIDDARFDNNPARINAADVTAVLSDDDITTEMYDQDFPKAKRLDLPQMSSQDELFMSIATGKADVTFTSPALLKVYEKTNPGKIKIVPMAQPLRIYPDAISVDIHEHELLEMLNTAVDQVVYSGTMDRLIEKYAKDYNMDFLVSLDRPYTWNK